MKTEGDMYVCICMNIIASVELVIYRSTQSPPFYSSVERVRARVGLMNYGLLVMSLERNAPPKLGATMIIEGSWFQAIIVRVKKETL